MAVADKNTEKRKRKNRAFIILQLCDRELLWNGILKQVGVIKLNKTPCMEAVRINKLMHAHNMSMAKYVNEHISEALSHSPFSIKLTATSM